MTNITIINHYFRCLRKWRAATRFKKQQRQKVRVGLLRIVGKVQILKIQLPINPTMLIDCSAEIWAFLTFGHSKSQMNARTQEFLLGIPDFWAFLRNS